MLQKTEDRRPKTEDLSAKLCGFQSAELCENQKYDHRAESNEGSNRCYRRRKTSRPPDQQTSRQFYNSRSLSSFARSIEFGKNFPNHLTQRLAFNGIPITGILFLRQLLIPEISSGMQAMPRTPKVFLSFYVYFARCFISPPIQI